MTPADPRTRLPGSSDLDPAGDGHRRPGMLAVPQPRTAEASEKYAEVVYTTPEPRDREFSHLTPALHRLATLEAEDANRPMLRDQLARGFASVAINLAGRYRDRGEPRADLEQVAALGLLNAIDRFDPLLGEPFLAFAVPTITGELRRHFRDRTWSTHVPRRLKDLHPRLNRAEQQLSARLGRAPRVSELATELDLSPDEVLGALTAQQAYRTASLDLPLGTSDTGASLADVGGELDPRIDLIESAISLRPVIAALPDRERHILLMRFFGNMTQSQIAHHVGVSQMQVSRILARTLKRMRESLIGDQPPIDGR